MDENQPNCILQCSNWFKFSRWRQEGFLLSRSQRKFPFNSDMKIHLENSNEDCGIIAGDSARPGQTSLHSMVHLQSSYFLNKKIYLRHTFYLVLSKRAHIHRLGTSKRCRLPECSRFRAHSQWQVTHPVSTLKEKILLWVPPTHQHPNG